MKVPLISVITVVYNGASTLKKTIESVIKQNYLNIEYIIIDGGSTDNTVQIVEEYSHQINFWISEKDSGIYDAMNKGIRVAKGDWIYFLNADDEIYSPNTFSEIFNNSNINSYDIIYGDLICENSLGEKFLAAAEKLSSLKYRMAFGHSACFVKSSILKNNLFSRDYRIAADYDLFLKLYLKKEFKFHYVRKIVGMFNQGGISTTNTEVVQREHINIIKSNVKRFSNYYVCKYKIGLFLVSIKKILKRILGKRTSGFLIHLKYKLK